MTNSTALIGKRYRRTHQHSNFPYTEVFKVTSKVKYQKSTDSHYVDGVELTYTSNGRLLHEFKTSVPTHLLSSNFTEVC